MKLLLLALFVASTSANWLRTWRDEDIHQKQPLFHTKYQPGKEYVYRYESQVLTSLPAFTKSHGGIKIIAKVKFDFITARDVVMQMSLAEDQILSLSHDINNPSDLPPVKQLPSHLFTPLPFKQTQLIKPKLELPIKFWYENGRVTSIQVSHQETNWSIDLKRSILAMLQIRLQADSTSTTPDLPYNELSENNSTAFDMLEAALDGNCYSGISVGRDYNTTEENIYRVLKTRDPMNCVKLNSFYKITWPQTINECNCKPNLEQKQCKCLPTSEEYMRANPAYFNAKTFSDYKVVSSDRNDLLIKRCTQSGTYRYEYPGYPDQYLATFSNQSVEFIQYKDQLTIDATGHSWWRISDPWKHQILEDGQEQLMMSSTEIVTQAKTLINEMAVLSTQPDRFKDHLTVFYQLVENLRLHKNAQLIELFREYNATENYKKWKVMVDALAHCNTTVCDQFLMDQIASGARSSQIFPPSEATTVFMLWATNKVPTATVLDKFSATVIRALGGTIGQRQKMAYHHSLLCFGSMVRRYIHSEEIKKSLCALESDRLRHQKNIDACRKHAELIEGKLTQAENDEEKIAVLKALTNLGSLTSLTKLQQMMKKNETNVVRVHAIYAVKNLCFQDRKKVLQTLVPLLTDVTEDSEIRMASFIFYLISDPSTSQLHRLIEQEPDLDLKTFFVQTLQNELKLTGPNTYKRIQKAKQVLFKVHAFQMSPGTGSYEMKYGMRPDTDGDILYMGYLTTGNSPIPRTAAFQHRNILRGTTQHNFEIGYSAEGFDAMFVEMNDKPSDPRPHPNISKSLDPLPDIHRLNKVEPTMTLYIRAEGQHVAFVHLDTEAITGHMMQAIRLGQAEIPIKLFQTYVSKPEQNKKLQPHGMWQVTERVDAGVIDIDGVLIIRKPEEGQRLPNISFGSEKMFRHEKKTLLSQYVRCGFAKTGVTSAMVSRQYISQQQWNVSYSFSMRNLTFNVSKPTQEILMVEMNAYTNTFVLPMRVPDIVKEKSAAFRDIVTVDPERVKFNKEIQALKSIELKSWIEGDICVPELYTFVRDRLHLLPSVLSMKKQHVKLTIKPAVSYSTRNYTFSQSLTDIKNEVASRSSNSHVSDSSSSESDENGWSFRSLGSFKNYFAWPSSEEYQSGLYKKYDPLRKLSLGSIRRMWQGRISSQSNHRTLSMVAKLISQYEHNHPVAFHLLSCERPPVPSVERNDVVLTALMTRVFNPSISQIVSQTTVSWGEKGDPTKKKIDTTTEHTAMYKDNVCYEQSAYGCKDQYGVFYPIWYNQTTVYESHNTDLVQTLLRAVQPNYMNFAEKVLVERSRIKLMPLKQMTETEVNITKIYRQYEDQVDVALTLDGNYTNMSRVYLPMEKALDEILHVRPMYPLGSVRPVSQFMSGHEQIEPFYSRDKCVVENARAMSMDYKRLMMPKSDCEVILVGDCARENKELLVSLKPIMKQGSLSVEEKILRVVLGASAIRIHVKPGSLSATKVFVNDNHRELDSNNQIIIKQREHTVAIIECKDDQCELKSSKHELYVKINSQRVKVEVQNGRSKYLCGLCSPHPELRMDNANYQQSMQMFENNRKQGEQCYLEQDREVNERFARQWTVCQKLEKYKVVHTVSDNQLKVCVTVDRLPLCNRQCWQKSLRLERLPARCVSQEVAQKINLVPTMEGNEMYLEDEAIIPHLNYFESKNIKVPISLDCQ